MSKMVLETIVFTLKVLITTSADEFIYLFIYLFIPSHMIVAGCYGFTLVTRVSIRLPPIFSFPDDNLSKCLRNFTKLGLYIDIVEIWFGNVNG